MEPFAGCPMTDDDLFGYTTSPLPTPTFPPFPSCAKDSQHTPYPSPPASNSSLKRIVPLPTRHRGLDDYHDDFDATGCDTPSSAWHTFGGLLDSPAVHVSGLFDLPPSPPQTPATPQDELDEEFFPAPIDQDDLRDGFYCENDGGASLFPASPTSFTQPLSPLSPEWDCNFLGGMDVDDPSQPLCMQSPTMGTHDLPMHDDDESAPVDPFSPSFQPSHHCFESAAPIASSDNPLGLDLLVSERPRSPASVDFFAALECAPKKSADVDRLLALRVRSQEAERRARQAEVERVDAYGRAEAKRERKRMKERSREIEALLRLNLEPAMGTPFVRADSERYSPSIPKRKKGSKVIRSLDQLVARMVMRRRDREAVAIKGDRGHVGRSPLCQVVSADDFVGGEDEQMDMEEDGLGLDLDVDAFGQDDDPWTMNCAEA